MKILIFGASGMVGSGVLRECLGAQDVEFVRSISRAHLDIQHAKLEQVIRPDFAEKPSTLHDDDLLDVDACFLPWRHGCWIDGGAVYEDDLPFDGGRCTASLQSQS